ncbi:type II secretion system protein GspD [Pseudoalteromonas xiamenensis]
MKVVLMNRKRKLTFACLMALSLSACSTSPYKLEVGHSYLKDKYETKLEADDPSEKESEEKAKAQAIASFSFVEPLKTKKIADAYQFDDVTHLSLSADGLPLNEFLHYVFGEVLKLNYVLGDGIKADETQLTLNIKKPLTQRALFELVESMLAERGYLVQEKDDIFFITQSESQTSTKNFVYGYGSEEIDVPKTNLTIWQYVPFKYGFNGSLQLALSQFANVQVYPEPQNNLFNLRGKREDILKALELFKLLDTPKTSGKHISMYRTVYSDIADLVKNVKDVLLQEGLSVSGSESASSALSILPLPQIGALLLFAQESKVLERAAFWLEKLDQPQQGDDKNYFIYSPRFSRATDLGESLAGLLGGGSNLGTSTTAKTESSNTRKAPSAISIGSDLGMVIDDRANSIIFHTSGNDYRSLLPLIKRLDVMPKQIMLEMLIAEVTLSDEFAMGVEFALKNGNYTASTKGAFGLDKISGLNYVLQGIDDSINLRLFESNSLVEVLSRPSIVVRDGADASISIGTKLPTVGSTTSDPDGQRQTTQVVYQSTGVELTVTPTVNAQGLVIMEIEQNISNQEDTGNPTVAGSPAIFERKLKTEAIASSGQTIILGGLISENNSNGNNGLPGLSKLPLIGSLFQSEKKSKKKTELVILVTPKVIESGGEWERIKADLQSKFEALRITN